MTALFSELEFKAQRRGVTCFRSHSLCSSQAWNPGLLTQRRGLFCVITMPAMHMMKMLLLTY